MKQYGDKGLAVVVIDFEGRKDDGLKFIEKNNLSAIFLSDEKRGDPGNVTRGLFQAGPFPFTFIIDSEGRILYLHGSFKEVDDLKAKVEEEIKWIMGL